MTDITQLAEQAGFTHASLRSKTLLCNEANLAKLEQLLRDKFIVELGEPVGCMYMGKKFISASSLNMKNIDDRFEPLYALKEQPK